MVLSTMFYFTIFPHINDIGKKVVVIAFFGIFLQNLQLFFYKSYSIMLYRAQIRPSWIINQFFSSSVPRGSLAITWYFAPCKSFLCFLIQYIKAKNSCRMHLGGFFFKIWYFFSTKQARQAPSLGKLVLSKLRPS